MVTKLQQTAIDLFIHIDEYYDGKMYMDASHNCAILELQNKEEVFKEFNDLTYSDYKIVKFPTKYYIINDELYYKINDTYYAVYYIDMIKKYFTEITLKYLQSAPIVIQSNKYICILGPCVFDESDIVDEISITDYHDLHKQSYQQLQQSYLKKTGKQIIVKGKVTKIKLIVKFIREKLLDSKLNINKISDY